MERQRIEKEYLKFLSIDTRPSLPSVEPYASVSTLPRRATIEHQSLSEDCEKNSLSASRRTLWQHQTVPCSPGTLPEPREAPERNNQERSKVMAQIMNYLYFLIGHWYLWQKTSTLEHFRRATQYENPGNSTDNTGKGPKIVASDEHSQYRGNTCSTKRGRPERREDDEESPEERNSRRRKLVGNDFVPQRKFACPFFKHNSLRFRQMRSCPGPGWATTHRLK